MVRFVVCLGVLGAAPTPAYAHKIVLTATATDLAVAVEAKYEDGELLPAGSRVALLDENGTEIADGVTDETGECRLSRPAAGVYSVTVDDRQGHFQKVVIVVRDGESSTAQTAQRNRFLMGTAGVAVIGLATIAAVRMKRKAPVNPNP